MSCILNLCSQSEKQHIFKDWRWYYYNWLQRTDIDSRLEGDMSSEWFQDGNCWKINAVNKNLRLCVCFSLHPSVTVKICVSRHFLCLLIHVCILARLDLVLTAPQLLWEVLDMLFVHRWLWKAPLQWNKPSLSLASMAWACCLTISEEWSYSTSHCQEQHGCATRTERRRKAFWKCTWERYIVHAALCYTYFTFIWEDWRSPHESRETAIPFSSVTIPCSPYSPHFQTTHSTLIDSPLDSSLLQQPFNMFHSVVGNMANTDERTCDAGWQGVLWSRCLWITEYGWRHAAAAKPPH